MVSGPVLKWVRAIFSTDLMTADEHYCLLVMQETYEMHMSQFLLACWDSFFLLYT